MANGKDIQKQIDDLQALIDTYQNAEVVGPNEYIVNGRSMTRDQVNRDVATLRSQIASIRKVAKPIFAALDEYNNAGATLARAREIAANPITETPGGVGQAQANADLAAAEKKYNKAKAKYDSAVAKDYEIPQTPSLKPSRSLTQEESKALGMGRAGVAGGFGATTTARKKQQVSNRTGGAGGTGGTAGAGTGGAGAGAGAGTGGAGTGTTTKTAKTPLPKNWESTFRRMFPSQAWLLDVDRTQFPQLYKSLQTAVKNRSWESDAAANRWLAELKNTDFYKGLANKDMVRQVKAVVGDLGFDSVPFNKFLTNAMNLGWEGDNLKAEVYKEAFRKNDDGTYANPTAQARASKSTDYLKVAAIGNAYFNRIPVQTIENRLSGGLTDEDVNRQQRELAKAKYGHLANLIDQGLTLADIADPFKQQAASLLEKTPDQVDMSQADFEAAYNYGEPGKKRMMTTGEWQIMLRSDAKYGWQNTNNAKAEARRLATSITQAFGRVI